MPARTLRVHVDAERQSLRYPERGNDQNLTQNLWELLEVTTVAKAV
jgi:hypothetical protein